LIVDAKNSALIPRLIIFINYSGGLHIEPLRLIYVVNESVGGAHNFIIHLVKFMRRYIPFSTSSRQPKCGCIS